MFKLVVACAFFAVAAAKPGALFYQAPIAQYSTFIEPATTTIVKQDSSVLHPTKFEYYSPAVAYAHLIKKRSPQWASPAFVAIPQVYNKPLIPSPYIVPTVSAVPTIASPAVHLIKKRSVVPTTYIAAQPAAPLLTTSYAASPLISSTQYIPSTQYIASNPLIPQAISYAHLIKKRSAPLLSTFVAPTAYSHQSRLDVQSTHTPIAAVTYNTPITYASPLAYTHLY